MSGSPPENDGINHETPEVPPGETSKNCLAAHSAELISSSGEVPSTSAAAGSSSGSGKR